MVKEISITEIQQKNVLNFSEAVQFTGFSQSYLYKLTSKEIIPHSKPTGKFIFFSRQDLENWLLGNKRKSNEQIITDAATYTTIKKGV